MNSRRQLANENMRLRHLGELQCNRLPFPIDFKRDPVDRLERRCAIHNCQRQGIPIPEFLVTEETK